MRPVRAVEVCIDVVDPRPVAAFWRDPGDWIARAEELGATRLGLHDDDADWFCVMADPAGNEFCICRESDP